MKIGLINENSQASKNETIYKALKKVADLHGYEVFNYGMYSAEDKAQLTYVQNGILACVLLNSGAVDYVVTGCGTGEGAMLACNSFPGVICGHVTDPLDAYTFAQINDGNAISINYALKFGWGGELNLEYIFEKLFCEESGQGYPRERAVPEQTNKKILDEVKKENIEKNNNNNDINNKIDLDKNNNNKNGDDINDEGSANIIIAKAQRKN